jgi:hypothetical protein
MFLPYLFSILISYILFRHLPIEVTLLFFSYSLVSVVIYSLQIWAFPEFYGFTPAGIAGTDDSFFYSQVAETLPRDLPVRENYLANIHNYSIFLNLLNPFSINHPIDILFYNIIPLSLLPPITKRVANDITGNLRIGSISFKLSAICPFILANGIILIREVWVAALFIGSLYLMLNQRFILLFTFILTTFYFRVGSGGLLLFSLVSSIPIFYYKLEHSKYRRQYLFVFFITMGIVSVASIPAIISEVGLGTFSGFNLLREEYLSVLRNYDEDSELVRILDQPIYVRLPLSLAFFYSVPFFNPNSIIVNGEFVVRNFFRYYLYPILFVFYFFLLIRSFVSAIQMRDIQIIMIHLTYTSCILIISQISIIVRHKVMLMPLMYILVAHGMMKKTTTGTVLGIAGSICLIAVQVLSKII